MSLPKQVPHNRDQCVVNFVYLYDVLGEGGGRGLIELHAAIDHRQYKYIQIRMTMVGYVVDWVLEARMGLKMKHHFK